MATASTDDLLGVFHDSAASGDVQRLKALLSQGDRMLNATNSTGWTALMFAARFGQREVTELLLSKGCNTSLLNTSGQTAQDIARFWNHPSVTELLEQTEHAQNSSRYPGQGMSHFFANKILDRSAHHRKNDAWLQESFCASGTCIVLFSNLQPYVVPSANSKSRKRLFITNSESLSEILENASVRVFLGTERESVSGVHRAWFGLDVSAVSEERIKALNDQCFLLSDVRAALQMEADHAGIVAQARSVLAWLDRYQFCPTCGSKTRVDDGGYKRTCLDQKCRSNIGIHNTSYPRTDPTVIMAVVSPDKQFLLLARGQKHPPGMFSCLAGFMEPGESIEDACRRETVEETGVMVGQVDYHSCQFWPMPCSLMIGCIAYATSTDIKVDPEEISDARWFSRLETVQLLNHTHPDHLFCPPDQAIAHHLIKTWVQITANL